MWICSRSSFVSLRILYAIRSYYELGLESLRMPSGAAHDTQIIAAIAPAGMLFVPSKEGRSHSPAEWTAWKDIEAGANTLLNALARLAA